MVVGWFTLASAHHLVSVTGMCTLCVEQQPQVTTPNGSAHVVELATTIMILPVRMSLQFLNPKIDLKSLTCVLRWSNSGIMNCQHI
jgi:hypothetical protein